MLFCVNSSLAQSLTRDETFTMKNGRQLTAQLTPVYGPDLNGDTYVFILEQGYSARTVVNQLLPQLAIMHYGDLHAFFYEKGEKRMLVIVSAFHYFKNGRASGRFFINVPLDK